MHPGVTLNYLHGLLKGLHSHTNPCRDASLRLPADSPERSLPLPAEPPETPFLLGFLTTPALATIIAWASLQYFMYILFMALLGFEGFD